MIGQKLSNRYEITARLGKGAMGTVYRATDLQNGKEVALKVISNELVVDPDMLERFKREGEALSKLKHPNIVEFLDAFQYEDQYVIVMEYVSGGSLHELISKGPLPIDRANRIALELCDALIRSHHLNIIHRDLKPENVLLTGDGTPRLADFGVARLSEGTRMTRSGTQVGTPYYMSPEAWEGRALDAQTDIWSLGVILFEMLTGQVPFGGDTGAAVMNKILTTHPPDLKKLRVEVPSSFAKIVGRMLTRDKKRRYQTMRQVAVDLESVQFARTSARPKAKLGVLQRSILKWTLLGTIGLGLIASGTWGLSYLSNLSTPVPTILPATNLPAEATQITATSLPVTELPVQTTAIDKTQTPLSASASSEEPVSITSTPQAETNLPFPVLTVESSGKVLYVDAGESPGGDGSQTKPFNTIQAAIDQASEGDAIKVAIGVYDENLMLIGKTINLQGGHDPGTWQTTGKVEDTVIDGGKRNRTVAIVEGSHVVMEGFTITNGENPCTNYGGGGGIVVDGGRTQATLQRMIIRNNFSRPPCGGGGIEITGAKAAIINSIIANNTANDTGGVDVWIKSRVMLINVTVVDNHRQGVGTFEEYPGEGYMLNSIVWGNDDQEILGSNIQVINSLTSFNPLFVDAAHGDYHLQPGSPAIDAGALVDAPALDIDSDPRPVGAAIDIGADEYINK